MKEISVKEILLRWKANGGSAWDPFPTLVKHAYHALFALSVLLLCLYLGVDWYYTFYAVLLLPVLAEALQWFTQKSKKEDKQSFLRDCILDVIEYWFAIPFAWVKEAPMLFVALFIVWWFVYLNLLINWVKPAEEV